MKCHSDTNSNGQCDYCGYVDNTIENPCICECHKEAINRPDFTILAGSELTVKQSLELMRRWDNHDALLEACKLYVEYKKVRREASYYQQAFESAKDNEMRREYKEKYLELASKEDSLNDAVELAIESAIANTEK